MGYTHSLTFAAQMQVNDYIEKQLAKASAELNRFQTAEDLLIMLTDCARQSTPGFVLRRHIQNQGGLVSREECADLSRTGNVPWPEEITARVAKALSQNSYKHHGRLPISTANWERYLTDDITQGIQRDMIFKLAIVTCMGREETMELLMACGQGPYNVRRPEELILWFCQRVPGVYTWQGVQRLMDAWKLRCREAPANGAIQAPPTAGFTQQLRWEADRMLDDGSPAGMAAEQELIETMVQYRFELTGFSVTAQSRYRRLLDYLSALYLAGGRTNIHKLITAMYQRQRWDFHDLFQTVQGERYMFRGYWGDETAKLEVDLVLDRGLGGIAKFCKGYYKRANSILNSSIDTDRRSCPDRRDILLLGYFIITGYMEAAPSVRASFWELTAAGASVDARMKLLQDGLELLRVAKEVEERRVLCCRVLNELLAEFELHSFYIPGPFDRFILFALLTDHPTWTARYLLGEELES